MTLQPRQTFNRRSGLSAPTAGGHAYFTGADDPYDKLRGALRADISDEAWATVNSTVSRPFRRPNTGKVAIKVINHFGDEVMKVIAA